MHSRTVHRVLLALVLLAALTARLYHFTSPPVDGISWRTTQTLMVARNFFRDGMNLFVPRVDWRMLDEPDQGGRFGGAELQITPFLTAGLYHAFGVKDWAGRVFPLLFSMAGLCYFYLLIRRLLESNAALIATSLLAFSPFFLFCGRVQMPESLAFAASFAALFHYDRWLESRQWSRLPGAVAAALLMLVAKQTMLLMIVPMAFLTWVRLGWRCVKTWQLHLFAFLVGLPAGLFTWWVFVVVPKQTGMAWVGADVTRGIESYLDPAYFRQILRLVWTMTVGQAVCVLGVAGLFACGRRPRNYAAHAWVLGVILFFVAFPRQNKANVYYQMALAPPACMLAGRFLAALWTKRKLRIPVVVALLAAVVFPLTTTFAWFYRPTDLDVFHCGEWIRDNTPSDTRVLSTNPSPALLYHADRVGWLTWHYPLEKDLIQRVVSNGGALMAVPDAYFDSAHDQGHPNYNAFRDYFYDSFDCYHGEDFVAFFLDRPADLCVPEEGRLVMGIPATRKFLRDTWGWSRANEDGTRTWATTGPTQKSSIRFKAPSAGINRIAITLHSSVPQEVQVRWNGDSIGILQFPTAYKPRTDILDSPPSPDANGFVCLSLEPSQGKGIAVHEMRVVTVDQTDARP